MLATYSIGSLARAAQVPTTTVRYYERRGLLTPASRSRAKYRVYGDPALDRLNFIRAAQDTGFTLKDIEVLLSILASGGEQSKRCGTEMRAMIARRLAEVQEKIADLQRIQTVLTDADATCRASKGPCGVMTCLTVKNRRKSA